MKSVKGNISSIKPSIPNPVLAFKMRVIQKKVIGAINKSLNSLKPTSPPIKLLLIPTKSSITLPINNE